MFVKKFTQTKNGIMSASSSPQLTMDRLPRNLHSKITEQNIFNYNNWVYLNECTIAAFIKLKYGVATFTNKRTAVTIFNFNPSPLLT
jgi:hypothetical protein